MHRTSQFALGVFAVALLPAACSDATGPTTGSQVAVRFGRSTSSASLIPSTARFSRLGDGADELVVQGTNGTLKITNVSFIVAEMELECEGDDDRPSAPACGEFKAPPSFVKLPLGSGMVDVASAGVPAGSYTELEFEVENVKPDDDDSSAKRAQIAALLASIRAVHADFPDRASMVVEGSFTPTGSAQPVAFRTYFDAEIEVEMDLSPPLSIGEAGAARALTVDVQPALWFKRSDGTVLDLSRLDFVRTRALVEFELEMEKGFRTVEFDD